MSFFLVFYFLISSINAQSVSPSTTQLLPGVDVPTGSTSYASPSSTITLRVTDAASNQDVSSAEISTNNRTREELSSPSDVITLVGEQSTIPSVGNATASATTSSQGPVNTQPCNNYPEFCDRRYSNVTEVCAHNSPFVRPDNAASNQMFGVIDQLEDGIRMLQGQIHYENQTLFYCHTSCDLLNVGTVEDYLTTVASWVQTHPYDVVTILFGNSDQVDPGLFSDALKKSGLSRFVYTPPQIPMGVNDWPTLGEMILLGKRIVVFMDYGANQKIYPYIMDEFTHMWETPFSPQDIQFPCTIDRPPGLSRDKSRSLMYLANHNLNIQFPLAGKTFLLPNVVDIAKTNGLNGTGSLGLAVEHCTDDWNRPPKFLLVDFYNEGPYNGSVFEAQARANNVEYHRRCCGSAARSSSSTIKSSPLLLGAGILFVAFSW